MQPGCMGRRGVLACCAAWLNIHDGFPQLRSVNTLATGASGPPLVRVRVRGRGRGRGS